MKYFFLFFCLAVSSAWAFGNEPIYVQKIILEFDSPEAAQKAVCEKLELPIGKTLALSSRWDDTNGEHLLMSKTLAENGWKGTFFLNRCDEDYVKNVVNPILADGGSIGVHTLTHPHLETVSPNRMFYEILGNRIDLEVKTNQCVTTFTFPYGLGSKSDSVTSAAEQGEALRRCGLLGGPETIHMAERMGLKPEEFISPYRFNANDSDPTLETFEKGFENGMNQLREGKSACGPYMALGTHSWQRRVHPDGFERLGKILAAKSNQPEIWYCNSNEYTAYRANFVLENSTRLTAEGSKVTLELLRYTPEYTGARTELGLKITPSPVRAVLSDENQTLEITENGEMMVPEASAQRLPVCIDRTDNTNNERISSNSLQCTKIPGLYIGTWFDVEKSQFCCFISNKTGKTLKNATITAHCPLKYTHSEDGSWFMLREGDKNTIDSGESMTLKMPLIQVPDEKYEQDAQLFDAQWDFQIENETYRVHAATTLY